MSVALLYSGLAVAGYVMAIPLRTKAYLSGYIAKVLPLVVTMLIFLMGFRVGSNEDVVADLGTIGLLSFIMAVVSLLTSVAAMRLLRKALGYNRYGELGEQKETGWSDADAKDLSHVEYGRKPATETQPGNYESTEGSRKFCGSRLPWGSIRYVTTMALGFFVGFWMVIKTGSWDYEAARNITALIVTYGLYTLVFLVGVDLGLAGDIIQKFRETGAKVLLFPLAGAIATIATIFLFFPLLPLNGKETLGVACTFGWYSLGPNILLDHGLVMASAYSFLTNFTRDMLALFTIPFVARKFGYLETITMAQAASMDVCISTIITSTNRITTAYAFASGLVFTIVIPILMPVVASI